MALALVLLPTQAVVDETMAPTLTAITGAQHRLEKPTVRTDRPKSTNATEQVVPRGTTCGGREPCRPPLSDPGHD